MVLTERSVLEPRCTSTFSCLVLLSSFSNKFVPPICGEGNGGVLRGVVVCLDKLPEEDRVLMVGSVKLAMALVVLSRAKAAKVNSPVRFAFVVLID